MKLIDQVKSSRNNAFFEFLFWYRFVSLAIVLLFYLFDIKEIALSVLIFAFGYNIFLRIFRKPLQTAVRKYPVIILGDVAISFALLSLTGGYKSPFQLYTFSPVISGGYLLGYWAAFAIALLQSALYYEAFTLNGYRISGIMLNGEQLITDYLSYFIVGISVAYIAELVYMLGAATGKKEALKQDLEETLSFLQRSSDFTELSKRELQVLSLVIDGKTIEQAANILSISKESAKTYLSRIYRKIGVSSRHEAMFKAFERESVSDRI